MSARKIRVLIVDDSAVARDILEKGLSRDPEIEVVGKASDAWAARDKIVFLKPDVMTLDVEMPKMDGIDFLRRLMPQLPIPTIIVSAVTEAGSRRAIEALAAGAVDVIAKPGSSASSLLSMIEELSEKVKAASLADVSKLVRAAASRRKPSPVQKSRPQIPGKVRLPHGGRLIAIGASTGGTAAIHEIIESLPSVMPPILIVQHMPPMFTRMFADSLNRGSNLTVEEAVDGRELEEGLVLVAPGDYHMRLVRGPTGSFRVALGREEKVSGHRPSVDELFRSVARLASRKAIGVLLTGMGRDGASGLGEMRKEGSYCIAQDQESSVVWGMPGEAWQEGAADALLPVSRIAAELASRAAM